MRSLTRAVAFFALLGFSFPFAEPEHVLSSFIVPHNEELVSLLHSTAEGVFLLLVRRGCRHSNDFLKLLVQIVDAVMRVQLQIFYCDWDDFCAQTFQTQSYPDFRFYPPRSLNSSHVAYPATDLRFRRADLVQRFIERHDGAVFKSMAASDVSAEALRLLRAEAVQYEENVAFVCEEDFDSSQLLRNALIVSQSVMGVSVRNCAEMAGFGDFFLEKFLAKRARNSKSRILFVSYIANDYAIFKGKYEQKVLSSFFAFHSKAFVLPLKPVLVHQAIESNRSIVTLFFNDKKEKYSKTFREFVKEFKKDGKSKQFLFSLCDFSKEESLAKDKDLYGCLHLKRLAGVAADNLPSLVVFDISADFTLKKYRYSSQHFQLWSISQFFDKFTKSKPLPYLKHDFDISSSEFTASTDAVSAFRGKGFPSLLPSFVFLYGDVHLCPVCETKLTEFIEIVQNSTVKNKKIREKMNFFTANVLRNELDELVVADLPLVAFVDQHKQITKATPVYDFQGKLFQAMIELLLRGGSLSAQRNLLNLNLSV